MSLRSGSGCATRDGHFEDQATTWQSIKQWWRGRASYGPTHYVLEAGGGSFAASFGWGVMASPLVVAVVQGALTLVGLLVGDILGTGYVAAITAVGGLLLVGVALRLLRIKPLPVGDLLPALAVAPALVAVVSALRG